jgi:hypothetical protein
MSQVLPAHDPQAALVMASGTSKPPVQSAAFAWPGIVRTGLHERALQGLAHTREAQLREKT